MWQRASALVCQEVQGLKVESFTGGSGAGTKTTPAVVLHQVQDATFQLPRGITSQSGYLQVTGERSRSIRISDEANPAGSPMAQGAPTRNSTRLSAN